MNYIDRYNENVKEVNGTKLIIRDGKFSRLIQGRFNNRNKLDGYGQVFYDVDQATFYVGNWKDGRRHGQGTILMDNYLYSGQWTNDKMTGFGRVTFSKRNINGLYYEGELKNSKYHGHGRFVFRNGDVFEGIYSNGIRNGYGKLVKINGDIYEGTWNGSKKITGTLRRTKHGCEIKFRDGKPIGDDAYNSYCLNFT